MAFGEAVKIEIQRGPASAVLLIRAPKTGLLTRCRIPDHLRDHPDVDAINFDYLEGQNVRAFRVGPDRIGDIFVTGSTAAEAEAFAARIADQLEIVVVEPENPTGRQKA